MSWFLSSSIDKGDFACFPALQKASWEVFGHSLSLAIILFCLSKSASQKIYVKAGPSLFCPLTHLSPAFFSTSLLPLTHSQVFALLVITLVPSCSSSWSLSCLSFPCLSSWSSSWSSSPYLLSSCSSPYSLTQLSHLLTPHLPIFMPPHVTKVSSDAMLQLQPALSMLSTQLIDGRKNMLYIGFYLDDNSFHDNIHWVWDSWANRLAIKHLTDLSSNPDTVCDDKTSSYPNLPPKDFDIAPVCLLSRLWIVISGSLPMLAIAPLSRFGVHSVRWRHHVPASNPICHHSRRTSLLLSRTYIDWWTRLLLQDSLEWKVFSCRLVKCLPTSKFITSYLR